MKTKPRVRQEEDSHHRCHEDQTKSRTRGRWLSSLPLRPIQE
ncbi:hypothetical protein [Metabacillus endolithicus]